MTSLDLSVLFARVEKLSRRPRRPGGSRLELLVPAAWLTIAAGCSHADPGLTSGPTAIVSGAGGATGVATGGAGGLQIGLPEPPTAGTATSDDQQTIAPDAACATGMAEASLRHVNMFIQFDRSRSMTEDDKWTQAAAALNGFFADPASAGLRIALRFFPHDEPAEGCTGGDEGVCDVMACSRPLVPLAEVVAARAPTDRQEALLVQAVRSSAPSSNDGQSDGTPLYPALAGALQWASSQRAAVPDEETAVVLVTDGEPNGCEEGIATIAQLAADAYTKDGVRTYAIGIAGASEAQMNRIARAGGTKQAFFAGDTSTAQRDLLRALDAIRGTVLSCVVPLPRGHDVDTERVNVTFTPSSGATEFLRRSTDAAGCRDHDWYYNGNPPTQIMLCPTTCERVQADAAGRLGIVLGCQANQMIPE